MWNCTAMEQSTPDSELSAISALDSTATGKVKCPDTQEKTELKTALLQTSVLAASSWQRPRAGDGVAF